MNRTFYTASHNLEEDVLKNRQPDTIKDLRLTYPGYEDFINGIYQMSSKENPSILSTKVNHSTDILNMLAVELQPKLKKFKKMIKGPNTFQRLTLAIDPINKVEICIGLWGKGFQVPIHGHTEGYMYERILSGSINFKFYDLNDPENRLVKTKETVIRQDGAVYADYYIPNMFGEAFIHSFEILEDTVSLHFLPGTPGEGNLKLYTHE